MKCKLSTINGWCGIFNKSCKECISSECKFIKKAYRQGRVEAEYFGYYKSDWIPVSEGLPDYRHTVLISTKWGVNIASRDSINEGVTDDFWDCPLDDSTMATRYVTAWMPLPEPYKGGDTE